MIVLFVSRGCLMSIFVLQVDGKMIVMICGDLVDCGLVVDCPVVRPGFVPSVCCLDAEVVEVVKRGFSVFEEGFVVVFELVLPFHSVCRLCDHLFCVLTCFSEWTVRFHQFGV